MVWFWRGSTKRMMVIRSLGSFLSFRIIMIIFFRVLVFDFIFFFFDLKIREKRIIILKENFLENFKSN